MKRGAPLKRETPLRAARWGVRKAPRKASWRDAFVPPRAPAEKLTPFEKAWLRWVRKFDCIACGAPAPSQAAHQTLTKNEKGTALKVDHTQTVPLCIPCHDDNDGRCRGRISRMSSEKRFALRAVWVRLVRERARPCEYDDALALQAAGLGSVLKETHGVGWAWIPASAKEAA